LAYAIAGISTARLRVSEIFTFRNVMEAPCFPNTAWRNDFSRVAEQWHGCCLKNDHKHRTCMSGLTPPFQVRAENDKRHQQEKMMRTIFRNLLASILFLLIVLGWFGDSLLSVLIGRPRLSFREVTGHGKTTFCASDSQKTENTEATGWVEGLDAGRPS